MFCIKSGEFLRRNSVFFYKKFAFLLKIYPKSSGLNTSGGNLNFKPNFQILGLRFQNWIIPKIHPKLKINFRFWNFPKGISNFPKANPPRILPKINFNFAIFSWKWHLASFYYIIQALFNNRPFFTKISKIK